MINQQFLLDYKDRLIQIYFKERLANYNRPGVLFIDFKNESSPNVYFLSLENMPKNISDVFKQDYDLEKKNVIFFYTFDNQTSNIMEIIL